MAMGSSSSGKAYHSSGKTHQSSSNTGSTRTLRYKGLFAPNVAPTSRAYCILFSFFFGVLLITAGSVFTRVILIKPMSGTHHMHTPPWPLALFLIALGVLTVLSSCITAWKYGLDDGDESLLEDDQCAYNKDDLFEQEFSPTKSQFYDNSACTLPRSHSSNYRTCRSSRESYCNSTGADPSCAPHHQEACPQHATSYHTSRSRNLCSQSHYQQTQELHYHTQENECPAHPHNYQDNQPKCQQHIPDVCENHQSPPSQQHCFKSQSQNQNSISRNDQSYEVEENGISSVNKTILIEQDQSQHKNSVSPLKNGTLTTHIHATKELNNKLSSCKAEV